MNTRIMTKILVFLSLTVALYAQAPPTQQPPAAPEVPPPAAGPGIEQLRPNYVLRPGDQVLIRAFEMDEISERPFRIEADGFINLPVLGRVQAGGLTVENFEKELLDLLKKYVRQPQVTVTVVQFASDTIFAVGAFKVPGIYPLGGRRNLVEMIAGIGGLLPTASRRIHVTRRKEYGPIPLPNAVTTPDGSGTTVEINLARLQESVNPAEDIVLMPFDVITVDPAQPIYVLGDVGRPGPVPLQERESMSITQVLAYSGGLTRYAKLQSAYILRPISNTSRRAMIAVNLKRVLRGEELDQPLLPNDVLFVPMTSLVKQTLASNPVYAMSMALELATLGLTIGR